MYIEGPSRTSNKRQRTRGKELKKWTNKHQKIPVTIPEEIMRPVGKLAQLLITEEGCVVRKFAPLTVKRWKDISAREKEKLLEEIEV